MRDFGSDKNNAKRRMKKDKSMPKQSDDKRTQMRVKMSYDVISTCYGLLFLNGSYNYN